MSLTTTIITTIGPTAVKKLIDYTKENHGSKVKMGDYAGCKIASFGDTACIVADPNGGKVVLLNSDTIASYEYIKKKERWVELKQKMYSYYNIYFKNGEKSHIRISQKKEEAMLRKL